MSRGKRFLVIVIAILLIGGIVHAAADGLVQSIFTGGGGHSQNGDAVLQSSIGQSITGRSGNGNSILCSGWPGCQSANSALPAPLLLVDDDDNVPDVRANYTTVLNALDVPYHIWDTGGADNEPDLTDLAEYQAIIWFTGANNGSNAGPGPAAEADLASWLDGGNCLFLSAQDYIFRGGSATVTSFMQSYMGLESASGTEVDYDEVNGLGEQFGALGTYLFSSPLPYAEAVDELLPDATAVTVFEGSGGGAPRSAAVAKDSGVYRTSYWGFPADFLAPIDLKEALNSVLDWCRIDVPIAGLSASNNGPTTLGQSTVFSATITAGTQISYSWDFGDGGIANGSVVSHTYSQPGVYTATVLASNYLNSQYADTFATVMAPITGLAADNGSPTALGVSTALTATILTGTDVTYSWDFGDGHSGEGASTSHHYEQAGIYTAEVTASNVVSTQSAQTIVTILTPVDGLVAYSDSPTALGANTSFSATVEVGDDLTYQWDFGDGSGANGPTANYTYGTTGIYTASVTASNAVSYQTDTVQVTILEGVAGLNAANSSPTLNGQATTLTATVTAGQDLAYYWDFGDGQDGIGPIVDHTYGLPGTYTATVTAENPVSSDTATTIVSIVEAITDLTAENDSPTEFGATTFFTATVSSSGPVSYSWDFGDGSNASGSSVSHVYAASGTFTATVTAENAAGSDTAQTTVLILTAISGLSAANDGPTALGQATHLTATVSTGDDISYSWDFGDGFIASGASATHTYGSTGTYTATVTAENAISGDTAQTTVSVLTAISGLSAANDGPTALGQVTQFTATVSAGDDLSYSWDFGDGFIANGASATHTYDSAGMYTATVTAENAISSDSAQTIVSVLTAISGLSAANDGPTALGQSTQFTATVSAGDDLSYTWDFGDGNLGTGPNPTHLYLAVGTYTATVTATNGVNQQSNSTLVEVAETIAGLTAANDGPTILGEPTWLAATVDAGSGISYQWDLGDGQGASEAVISHTYSLTGTYIATITASNILGQQTAETEITIVEPIGALIATNSSPSQVGQSTVLTATITGGGEEGTTFMWDFGDGESGTGEVVSHTYAAVGDYTAIVTATTLLESQTAQTDVDIRDPISGLAATSNSPTLLGTFTSLTATISSGTKVTYGWDFGDGTQASGRIVSHGYVMPGIYTVTLTADNQVSSAQDTIVISVLTGVTGLQAFASSPTQLNLPTFFTATVTGGDELIYHWDFGDGTTGSGPTANHVYILPSTYQASVTVTNAVSSDEATVMVKVLEPIAGLVASNNSPTPLGEETRLEASLTAGSGVNYEWNFGDGQIGSGRVVTHTYPAEGNFQATVTATNDLGQSQAETTILIQVPVAGLVASSSGPTPLGEATILTATVTTGTDPSFEWDFGDSNSGTGMVVEHTYSATGLYTVVVTASNAVSSQSISTTVAIVPRLQADFAASPLSGGAPLTVTFTNLTSGPLESCDWDFGDGGSSTECINPQHIFSMIGNFTITLTVQGGGQFDVISKADYIQVRDEQRIFLPVLLNSD